MSGSEFNVGQVVLHYYRIAGRTHVRKATITEVAFPFLRFDDLYIDTVYIPTLLAYRDDKHAGSCRPYATAADKKRCQAITAAVANSACRGRQQLPSNAVTATTK